MGIKTTVEDAANDRFEKFWAEDCGRRPISSHPTSIEKECARRSHVAAYAQGYKDGLMATADWENDHGA